MQGSYSSSLGRRPAGCTWPMSWPAWTLWGHSSCTCSPRGSPWPCSGTWKSHGVVLAWTVHVDTNVVLWWMLRSPSTALLIKDETRNVFYELEDPRDVQDRCVIKIYCKEPIYGTYPGHHNPHLANGDLRVRAPPHSVFSHDFRDVRGRRWWRSYEFNLDLFWFGVKM